MTLHACLAPAGLWGPGLSASAPGTTSLVVFNAFTTSSFSFQTKQSAKFLVFFPAVFVLWGTCLANSAAPRFLSPDGQLDACFGT